MNQGVFIGLLLFAAMVIAGASLMFLGPEDGSPEPPVIAFDEEHEADEVVVETVSPGLVWDEIQVQVSVPGGFMVEEGNLTRTHGMVFTSVDAEGRVREGDALRVCVEEPAGEEDGVEVTLRHGPSGEILGSWALLSVDACSALEEERDADGDPEEGAEEGVDQGAEEGADQGVDEGVDQAAEEDAAGGGAEYEGSGVAQEHQEANQEEVEDEGSEEDAEGTVGNGSG